jgi:hypothetical protein
MAGMEYHQLASTVKTEAFGTCMTLGFEYRLGLARMEWKQICIKGQDATLMDTLTFLLCPSYTR